MIGLAYCDANARIYYDSAATPLADGGIVRVAEPDELIPAPDGTIELILPGRRPLTTIGPASDRYILAAILPAGYTRLLVPAFVKDRGAADLPLFGYTFACVVNDRLYVAAAKTDEGEDWQPRTFAAGELEARLDRRLAEDPGNRVLLQVARCSREYGCFTAQNVFLERGEAALPVSPKCNARCVGCISELQAPATTPSPQERIAYETTSDELARIGIRHLERVPDGIVSFGQGCEGEPLLRSHTVASAIEKIRAARRNGTVNLNTNGSLPASLERCIDAGLQAVRVSLNSFRPLVYAAYYRPLGYALDDVLASIRLAVRRGVRTSINLLTHPGVTDDEEELAAAGRFLADVPVAMVQTRTLNIDPDWYFAAVGRPRRPLGMRAALDALRRLTAIGNFTHTH
ncbi:MAG: radical SAM protein [Candidatus Eremiobacteraeota bacterium]|nr:radical SAM protein [Candidatus Eremiobacteraeota bacterium]